MIVDGFLAAERKIPTMLGKIAIGVLALFVAMWWVGVDFTSAKNELTATAQGGAETMTGGDDGGWG